MSLSTSHELWKHKNHESSLSSLLLSDSSGCAQAEPLHWLQAGEQSRLFFQQEHLRLLQSVEQLNLITWSSTSGAGDRWVMTGTNNPSQDFHPHSSVDMVASTPFHCCAWKYTRKLWYVAAAEVGGKFCGKCVWLPFDNNYRRYLRQSKVPPGLPLERQTRAFSPASITSSLMQMHCWTL